MSMNPTVNSYLFSKKNTSAVKKQERFEKSKKYQKECEVSAKMQEQYLKGLN